MLAIAFTDYRRLLNLAPAFYIFGLILLAIVLIPGVGLRVNGQQAWIKVPGIGQFQPSEFVKVTTAMMLARYFGKNRAQALTVNYGNGRVFMTQLGHDVKALNIPGTSELIRRGTAWAAGVLK